MRAMRALPVSVLALAGCYRDRALDLNDLERATPQGERELRVEYRAERDMIFRQYDSLIVETAAGDELAFDAPASARIEGDRLTLSSGSAEEVFRLRHVEEFRVSSEAPERPWIITGVTLGAAIFGAFVGYEAAGTCSGELGCVPQGTLGMLLGIGGGLALTIPLTGKLRPELAPAAPER